jgi:hypothetical protein
MHFSIFLLAFFTSLCVAQDGYDSQPSNSPVEAAPTPTTSQCTQVVTQRASWGCTITNAAQTTTESIDCKGCVISTSLAVNGFFGHGPVCFNGRKTMTDVKVTATVQACATS